MMNNIIKDFEELIKSESEFWEKFKLLFVTSLDTRNWISPVKEVINIMIAEVERLFTWYKELLNSAFSNKLTLEQIFQINDLIYSSRNYLIKLNTGLTILIEQNNDERRDFLFKRGQEIINLSSEFHDKIDKEVKEFYRDLKKEFIQRFGNNPITVKDSYGEDIRIKSCGSDLNIVDEYNYRLSSVSENIESIKLILKALKLNSDETKEEVLN